MSSSVVRRGPGRPRKMSFGLLPTANKKRPPVSYGQVPTNIFSLRKNFGKYEIEYDHVFDKAVFWRRIASACAAEGQPIPFLDSLPTVVHKKSRGRPRKEDDEFRPSRYKLDFVFLFVFIHFSLSIILFIVNNNLLLSFECSRSGPATPDRSRGDVNDPDYDSLNEFDDEDLSNQKTDHSG